MNIFESMLEIPFVERTRRNHALEHATIHMLSRRPNRTPLAGRSTPSGFYVYGQVSTEEVTAAVNEALMRLKSGEHGLAIHPNCGTNLVTGAMLSGMAAFTMLNTGRRKGSSLERLPGLFVLMSAALLAAQPLGMAAQEHVTTDADLGDLRVTGIRLINQGRMPVHHVSTVS